MDHESVYHKIAILVVSCDKYAYVWPAFFQLFKKHWPDCPFKIYLLGNFAQTDFRGIVNLSVGEDMSWSSNLIRALDEIPEENIFLFLEDLFLVSKVDIEKVLTLFNWFLANNADCLRLNPVPRPDKPVDKVVGLVLKGTIYRASTVLTLWKKHVLSDLLVPGESAWEFETSGSLRSNKYSGFYSARGTAFEYRNVIIKGKWRDTGIRILRENHLILSSVHMVRMSKYEETIFLLKRVRTKILYTLPPTWRLAAKRIFSFRCQP